MNEETGLLMERIGLLSEGHQVGSWLRTARVKIGMDHVSVPTSHHHERHLRVRRRCSSCAGRSALVVMNTGQVTQSQGEAFG